MLDSPIRFVVTDLLPLLPLWVRTVLQNGLALNVFLWLLAQALDQVAWAEVRRLWREARLSFRADIGFRLADRRGVADAAEYPRMRLLACAADILARSATLMNLLLYSFLLFYLYVFVGFDADILPPLWLLLTGFALGYLVLSCRAGLLRTCWRWAELLAQLRARRHHAF